jgi:hypothetical protein
MFFFVLLRITPFCLCEGVLDNFVGIFRLTCGVEVTIGDDFIKGVILKILKVLAGGLPNGEISFYLEFYV